MEAPTIKDIQQKTIDLKIDNQKYRLTLSYGINLKITIECLDKKQSYENEFTSNEITKINRYHRNVYYLLTIYFFAKRKIINIFIYIIYIII